MIFITRKRDEDYEDEEKSGKWETKRKKVWEGKNRE